MAAIRPSKKDYEKADEHLKEHGLLDGRYTDFEQLGRGGFGMVFKAHDNKLNRDIAVKFILGGLDEKVRMEIESLARLTGNPHITHIFDAFTIAPGEIGLDPATWGEDSFRERSDLEDILESNVTVLTLELVVGQSMRRKLIANKNNKLRHDPRKAAEYMLQTCIGMDWAHINKIIHRDIKPDNLLIAIFKDKSQLQPYISTIYTETIKITDFGLAKLNVTQLEYHSVSGTLQYMAPEVILNGISNERTDIYSIGIVLYELLENKRPIQKADGYEEAMSRAGKEIFLPESYPRALRDIVHKACHPDPDQRYSTCMEMAVELKEFIRPRAQVQIDLQSIHKTILKEILLNRWQKGKLTEEDRRDIQEFKHEYNIKTAIARQIETEVKKDLNIVTEMSAFDEITSEEASPIGKQIEGALDRLKSISEKVPRKARQNYRSLTFLAILVVIASVIAYWILHKDVSAIKSEDRFSNMLGMEFVLIPEGRFQMGSPVSEPGRTDAEMLHYVEISKPFYMQTTEVTQRQWAEVMKENPSKFKDNDRPVENVSWEKVQLFIENLNNIDTQHKYSLPTEAQWEYACRAHTSSPFNHGACKDYTRDNILCQVSCLEDYAWFCGNAGEKTHPVAQKKPNTWGLYDMHGNVWEWCYDYKEDYPTEDLVIDPSGPQSGTHRVIRGGAFYSHAFACRSAYRFFMLPDEAMEGVGFRLICTLDKASTPSQ